MAISFATFPGQKINNDNWDIDKQNRHLLLNLPFRFQIFILCDFLVKSFSKNVLERQFTSTIFCPSLPLPQNFLT